MVEQIINSLTEEGAPFEYSSALVADHLTGQKNQYKVFKHALPCLSHLYKNLDDYAGRDMAVFHNRRLSYHDALNQAANLAQFLASSFGVKPGDRVALVMRNCPEWLVSFIAITSLGAVPALVNSRGAAAEIAHAVEFSDCDLMLLDNKTASVIEDQAVARRKSIIFDIAKSFAATVDGQAVLTTLENLALPHTERDTDDVALILFTSGTTGHPKGVLLSHRGALNALKANEFSGAIIGATMAAKLGIDLQMLAANQPQPSTLLMFPLFHVSGCYSVFLANLLRGGKLVMLSRWEAQHALTIMQDEKVTQFYGVPTMYWDVLNNTNLEDFDLSSLQSLSVAGQSTPVSLLKTINAAFPRAMMGSGYGMTETNGVISMTHGAEFIAQPDSVGQPLSISEIKITDESGEQLPTGESGEICLRGATVMLGYDNHPEANKQCFKGGWFHTGDVGFIDQKGKLFIVDRLTEMVISGGENIYCAEVERVLNQAPGVVETTTFGIEDDRLGEKLVALVRLSEQAKSSAEEIVAWSAKFLASYKVPAELLVIDQALERNATGKVLKAKAKEMYKSLAGAN